MRSGRLTLRTAALLAAAALALHELRYLLAPVSGSDAGPGAEEHAYLPLAAAVVIAVLALAGAQLVAAIVRAVRTGHGEQQPPDLFFLWLLSSTALMGVHAAQESAESMLATGRLELVAVLAGPGGPASLVLAVLFGLVVALALRGAGAAVAAAVRHNTLRRPRRLLARQRPHSADPAPAASVLARHLAGRAPPLAA
jgi:hypothetical protein